MLSKPRLGVRIFDLLRSSVIGSLWVEGHQNSKNRKGVGCEICQMCAVLVDIL